MHALMPSLQMRKVEFKGFSKLPKLTQLKVYKLKLSLALTGSPDGALSTPSFDIAGLRNVAPDPYPGPPESPEVAGKLQLVLLTGAGSSNIE